MKRFFLLFLFFSHIYFCFSERKIPISFELSQNGYLNINIYNKNGKLIRRIINGESFSPGKHQLIWDGKDEFGNLVPEGEYFYKGIVGSVSYDFDGFVGNNGNPPYGKDAHSCGGKMGIVVDSEDNIYALSYWEEAGANLRKYSPDGKTIWVDNWALQGKDGRVGIALAIDNKYLYVAYKNNKNEDGITRFLMDGREKGYPEEWIINKGSEKESFNIWEKRATIDDWRKLCGIRGLAVDEKYIYVSNYIKNRIEIYDKFNMELKKSFNVSQPIGICIDKNGYIYVCHSGKFVSKFNLNGEEIFRLEGFSDPDNIFIDSNNILYVTDIGDSHQIKKFIIRNEKPELIEVIGKKGGGPGKVEPNKFWFMVSAPIAVDSKGNIIISDNHIVSRMLKLSKDGKEVFAFYNGFVLAPWVEVSTPDFLYSGFIEYKINYNTKEWNVERILLPYDKKFCNTCYSQVRIFNGKKFLYALLERERIVIYDISQELSRRCSIIGGRWTGYNDEEKEIPNSNGEWIWRDKNLDGVIQEEEIEGQKMSQINLYQPNGVYIDKNGNIYMTDGVSCNVIELPFKGLDENGIPIYSWKDERFAIWGKDILLDFIPIQIRKDENENFYILGRSSKLKFVETSFNCGGNVLCKYNKNGKRIWFLPLPPHIAGFTVDKSFIYVGHGYTAEIYQYTAEDGFLIGKLSPTQFPIGRSGWLDHGYCVFTFTHPNGNTYIYAEEDAYGKMIRYRIKNIKTEEISGKIFLKDNL